MSIIVERDHIGFFGKMNSGKSSLMNLLTQQEASIVDSTPGTTADTKRVKQEIHGLGPVKLYDTAGFDEEGSLGDKKKKKVYSDLKECDLVFLVVDPSSKRYVGEKDLLEKARGLDKQILVVYNIFNEGDECKIPDIEDEIPLLRFHKKIIVDLLDPDNRSEILDFILSNFESINHKMPLLPFIEKDEYYVLNIPMDVETPPGRYLRPQAMCEEYITRNWAYPVSYRMDLGRARGKDSVLERTRFDDFINNFRKPPRAVITDSQAMDVIPDWISDEIGLTTFSIMMINYVSRGRLNEFVEGVLTLDKLAEGDKVLIVEACNHSRIGEDIGTVQIPNYIKKHYPKVEVEFNFGREFQDNTELENYSLIIHCGGCMISSQKLLARIRDLSSVGIPYTNYGLFLSYIQGKDKLRKVLKPWGLDKMID